MPAPYYKRTEEQCQDFVQKFLNLYHSYESGISTVSIYVPERQAVCTMTTYQWQDIIVGLAKQYKHHTVEWNDFIKAVALNFDAPWVRQSEAVEKWIKEAFAVQSNVLFSME